MPTVNVTPTYDYEAEQDAIKRRQAVLDAMSAQAGNPTNLPLQGMVQARVNPLEIMAKMAQAYLAKQGNDKLQEDRAALANRYSNDLRSGVDQYLKTSQGYTKQVEGQESLPPDVAGPPQTVTQNVQVPGDPRKAMLDALAANHPVLKQLGMQQLQGMGKDQLTVKDILGLSGYDPQSKVDMATSGDRSPARLKAETYSEPGVIGHDPQGRPIFGQKKNSTGQINWAPASPQVNVNTQQTAAQAAAKTIAEKAVENIVKSHEKVQGLPDTLMKLDNAVQSLQGGLKAGLLSDPAMFFAKLGTALGGKEVDPAVANTEAFKSQMANSVLEVLKTLRPASDPDRQYAEKAAGGNTTLEPQTMMRLINMARAAAGNALVNHNQLLEKAKKVNGIQLEALDTFEVPFQLSLPKNGGVKFNDATMQFQNEQFPEATGGKGAASRARTYNPATGGFE